MKWHMNGTGRRRSDAGYTITTRERRTRPSGGTPDFVYELSDPTGKPIASAFRLTEMRECAAIHARTGRVR